MKRTTGTAFGGPKHISVLRMEAIYRTNQDFLEQSIPTLFDAPRAESEAFGARPIQYLSAAAFELAFKKLCLDIRRELTQEMKPSHTILWLPNVGTSNFWLSLKSWPRIRDLVDEVKAIAPDQKYVIDPETTDITCHLMIDDAIFTGFQMSEYMDDILLDRVHDGYALIARQRFLIATVAGTTAKFPFFVREFISNRLEKLGFHPSTDHLDEWITFIAEVNIITYDESPEYNDDQGFSMAFYSSFKVPDSISFPELFYHMQHKTIPGVLKYSDYNPSDPDDILLVEVPKPPYRTYVYRSTTPDKFLTVKDAHGLFKDNCIV